MNDQSQLMNPPPPPSMMSQPLPPPPQMMSQPMNQQVMNAPVQLLGQSQAMNHPVMSGMNQPPPPPQVMNLAAAAAAAAAAQSQAMMMNNSRSFNPHPNLNKKFQNPSGPSSKPNNFGIGPVNKPPKMNRSNWKGKKVTTDKRPMNDKMRRMDNNPLPNVGGITVGPGGTGGYKAQPLPNSGGYQPPTLNELQSQNRLKTRKFYPKKKFNNRYVPYAPRNTTSFIIRAKKSGGIAELVSPCPVTPAVLPTPMFSPSREVLGDMAKEEWGVDGYGSMKGLIRLRSDGHELEPHDDEDEEEGGSSESDVEEHVEVERRLDHDLSRFEMIYPNYGGFEYHNVLENRVDDQDTHIAQLEEENLTLKERLFLMETELGDLRRRLQFLERRNLVAEDVNEEVVENSENDSEAGGSDAHASVDTREDNHVDAEDVSMEDASRAEINNKLKVDETSEKAMDDHFLPKEDRSQVKELEGKDIGGDYMVAEKQDGESKPREGAMDECRGNDPASERQNGDSKRDDAAQGDSIKDEKDVNE